MATDNASISSSGFSCFDDEFEESLDRKDAQHRSDGDRRRNDNDNNDTNHDNDDDDLPDQLVRKDDQAICCVRFVALFVLLLATIATSGFVYSYVANAEQEKFHNDFEAVSAKLVASMSYDFSHKVWGTRTIAMSIASAMAATGASQANLTVPKWMAITDQARYIAEHTLIAWSPLLRTKKERDGFESHVAETLKNGNPDSTYPLCYFCKDPSFGFVNPDTPVDIQGVGVRTCTFLEYAGQQGGLSEESCIALHEILDGVCICSTESMREADNETDYQAIHGANQTSEIFRLEEGQAVKDSEHSTASPMWQINTRAGSEKDPVMWNQMSDPIRARALSNMQEAGVAVVSETFIRQGDYTKLYSGWRGEPAVVFFYPVEDDQGVIVGSVTAELNWNDFARDAFPPNSDYVDVVIENSCGQSYTFAVDPDLKKLQFTGEGDLHEPEYDHMIHTSTFGDFEETVKIASMTAFPQSELDYCRYRFLVYATSQMESHYTTRDPIVYSAMVVMIFLFTAIVFLTYDCLVVRRQRKVMDTATKSAALVSTLFPKSVRRRLYQLGGPVRPNEPSPFVRGGTKETYSRKTSIRRFLDSSHRGQVDDSEPIADLFPSATVMFLDIAGFTAWSSERDPTQVFRLLEVIYSAFDGIAKRLGVFKVETIGDCYLAVAGLPEPRQDHAVVMAKFAYACMRRMERLTKELISTLGPSTGDLKARCGLHSGPVTAGVLRGDKARFQLFGDTINTASRMESKGLPDKIQASQQTVDLLKAAGRDGWFTPREDLVSAKGKGELQTYWIAPRTGSAVSTESRSSSVNTPETQPIGNQARQQIFASIPVGVNRHLVDWNVDFLYALLENLVQQRAPVISRRKSLTVSRPSELKVPEALFDEVVDVVILPPFQHQATYNSNDRNNSGGSVAKMDSSIRIQLRKYVTTIADLYRDVPFHNFEHASYVAMSAGKLMKRILRPDGTDQHHHHHQQLQHDCSDPDIKAEKIHMMTYGLSSDPLTQFAIVFSALIHDVDHTGLPNSQLIKMKTSAVHAYGNRSVAEQNSIHIAWKLLMDDAFSDLRNCICRNDDEMMRFRQVVVNSVMATDVADKELQLMRKRRWEALFNNNNNGTTQDDDGVGSISPIDSRDLIDVAGSMTDRKATIVLEYIIQASDVAHTMQHWRTYRKWNERLFEESYAAWINGQADTDPKTVWYHGELSLFDNYVIPLAERLHECGVFGGSYHESLHYAIENRNEWQMKGEEIVKVMSCKCSSKKADSNTT